MVGEFLELRNWPVDSCRGYKDYFSLNWYRKNVCYHLSASFGAQYIGWEMRLGLNREYVEEDLRGVLTPRLHSKNSKLTKVGSWLREYRRVDFLPNPGVEIPMKTTAGTRTIICPSLYHNLDYYHFDGPSVCCLSLVQQAKYLSYSVS